MFRQKTVVEEVEDPQEQISLEDAHAISLRYEPGDVIEDEVSFEKYGYLPQTLSEDEVGDVVLEWDAATSVTDLTTGVNVTSVKYVSTNGMMSDTPFKGVNIMVVSYQDGSRKTVKVVK